MSFKGLVQYVKWELPGQDDKFVKFLACNGVDMDYDANGNFTPDARKIARSFRMQSNLCPRVSYPVKHFVLSWNDEDASHLNRAVMIKAARDYLKQMGYDNTQYLIALHRDKNNPHIHIVANVVNDFGKRVNDHKERWRSVAICRDMTLSEGWHWGDHKCVSKAEIPHDKPAGSREDARYEIARAITAAAKNITSAEQLPLRLLADGSGVTARIIYDKSSHTPHGISFALSRIEHGKLRIYKFSGTQIDLRFSYSGLDRMIRLANKEPELKTEPALMIKRYDAVFGNPTAAEIKRITDAAAQLLTPSPDNYAPTWNGKSPHDNDMEKQEKPTTEGSVVDDICAGMRIRLH